MNISDIAALAGVSKAAVSRYFNDGYLSEEKRAAIERAVAETGYTPNIQAQTLRTRRSGQIGVVIPRLSSESVARVTDGISQVLSEQGYQLILATTANDPQKEVEYLELLRHHHVEGVIFLASIFTPDHQRILRNMHVPVVIVGQEYGGCSCVYHDDRGAARALTALMIERGARHPACIGVTKRDRAAGAERCAGFLEALRAAGLEPGENDMVSADFSIDSGYEKAGELLSRSDRPFLRNGQHRRRGAALVPRARSARAGGRAALRRRRLEDGPRHRRTAHERPPLLPHRRRGGRPPHPLAAAAAHARRQPLAAPRLRAR